MFRNQLIDQLEIFTFWNVLGFLNSSEENQKSSKLNWEITNFRQVHFAESLTPQGRTTI